MKPRLFVNSIPKAGAHLAVKALEILGLSMGSRSIGSSTLYGRTQLIKLLTRGPWYTSDLVVAGIEVPTPLRAGWVRQRIGQVGPGQFLRGHVRYSEYFELLLREADFRILHVVRDPRDVVVSHAHYLMTRPRHPFYPFYEQLGSWSARLAFSIAGGEIPGIGMLASLDERYRSMEGWRDRTETVTVRFEDLVGADGGGDEESQRRAVLAICELAEVEDPETAQGQIVQTLFGGTSTFRKGRIGGWQESFGPEHHELFEETAPGLLERWGYR